MRVTVTLPERAEACFTAQRRSYRSSTPMGRVVGASEPVWADHRLLTLGLAIMPRLISGTPGDRPVGRSGTLHISLHGRVHCSAPLKALPASCFRARTDL